MVGEVLSEGIGRPALVVSPGRSLPPRTVLLPGAGPSLQALIVAYAPAIRSVATCDDGAVAGDPASTFRTAVGTLVAPHGHPPQSPRRRHFTDREDWRIREFQHAWRRSEPWIRTYDRLGRTNWPSSH